MRVPFVIERPRAHSAARSLHTAQSVVLKNRVLQMSMATNAITFTSMDDRALLETAKHLVIEEHLATAALLRALMEIDTRRLYLGEGCASMFSYCTQVLHLAEGAPTIASRPREPRAVTRRSSSCSSGARSP